MNKLLVTIIAIILLSMTIPSALAGQISFWNMSETYDHWGIHNATNTGAVSTTDYPVFNNSAYNSSDNASDFEAGDSDYWTVIDHDDFTFSDGSGNDQPFSVSAWMKPESLASTYFWFSKFDLAGSDREFAMQLFATGELGIQLNDQADPTGTALGRKGGGAGAIVTGSWQHVVITYDGSEVEAGAKMYIDGSEVGSYTSNSVGSYTGLANRNEPITIAACTNGAGTSNHFDGILDHVMVFDHELNTTEISNLYNYGFITPPATGVNTYEIYVDDLYNDTDLSGVNVTFSPGCTNTTDVNGYARVTNETSGCSGLSGTLSSVNLTLTNYTSNETSYTIPVNSSDNAGMYQRQDNYNVTRLVTGALFNETFNITTDGGKTYTNGTGVYALNQDDNYTFKATGWYDKTVVMSSTNTTLEGVYNALWTLNATNAYTGNPIINFTINASNATYGYAESLTTTNGTLFYPSLQGVPVFYLFDATGYALVNATLNATNSTPSYTFEAYTNNSILVNVFDENTGSRIFANITIILTGNSSETTVYTTSGEYFFDNLTDGNYTVKLQGDNYTLKTYSVTVAERSSQVLNAFLSSSTNTVIFTIYNSQTNAVVADSSIGMYRLINSTLTLVESKSSDITGRAQFTYQTGVKYSFVITHPSYSSTSFSLDPVLFSSYDIYLEPTITESQDYGDVSVTYTPNQFFNNEVTTFHWTINSPNGVLTNYTVNVTWGNGSYESNGVNANGATYNFSVNITGAGLLDTVNLTYSYTTVFGMTKTFTQLFGIIGGDSTTIVNNIKEDYGMGYFERILFSVLMVIIIAGLATLFVNKDFGLFMGLIALSIFTYIGFMPLLMALISVLLGLFVLIKTTAE